MKSTYLLLLLSLFGSSALATSCTADYQCNIPYGFCSSSTSSRSTSPSSNSCTLIPGLGVDGDSIYFLGRCGGELNSSTGASDHPGTVYIFSSDLEGKDIQPLARLDEDAGATSANYSVVIKFIAISPYDFIIERSIRDANAFSAIDRQTYQETLIAGQRDGPAPSFDFDLSSGQTFSCLDFDVAVYP
jgi:hypothetical protein